MTPPRPTPAGRMQAAGSKQLAAVATAAIPVVMLSSLALATPAAAAPVMTEMVPQGTHGALDSQKVLAAVQARTASTSIPAATVASSVPRAVTALSPANAKNAVKSSVMTAVNASVQTVLKAQSTAVSHTVVAGDTVSAIADKYGVSIESVLSQNSLSATTLIHPGTVLEISGSSAASGTEPATASANYTVRAGDTLSGIAAQNEVSLASLFSLNGLNGSSVIHPGQEIKVGGAEAPTSSSPQPAAKPAGGGQYVIMAGDTLSAIASGQGVTLSALLEANGVDANAPIYPGKTLTIPGVSAASSSITPITPDAPPALAPDQVVPSTFLHYTYPEAVVSDANKNKALLLAAPAPTRAQMQEMVARTAAGMGVDPALAMAFAQQESGFNHQSVSPANAIGTMQVIPDAGDWASGLVGRKLNLLDPQDNVTAGVAIIRALHQGESDEDVAIAGYYQGQYSVSVHGLFADSVTYVAGIKANRELFR